MSETANATSAVRKEQTPGDFAPELFAAFSTIRSIARTFAFLSFPLLFFHTHNTTMS